MHVVLALVTDCGSQSAGSGATQRTALRQPDLQPHQRSASLNEPVVILHLLGGPAVSCFCAISFSRPPVQLCHAGLWSCGSHCALAEHPRGAGTAPTSLIRFPPCALAPTSLKQTHGEGEAWGGLCSSSVVLGPGTQQGLA